MNLPIAAAREENRGSWFAWAVLGMDAWLRRWNGVFEYSDDPQCAFRMQIVSVRDEILLADGTKLRPGDRVVDLHIWNEQFPCFSPGGATLSWARQVSRCVDLSLRELARYLAATPELADIRAVRADTRLAGKATTEQLLRICHRLGLERAPDARPPSFGEILRRAGENVFISLIVLARNARAFRADSIWRDRVQMFLSRTDLERRYGGPARIHTPASAALATPQSAGSSVAANVQRSEAANSSSAAWCAADPKPLIS